MCRAAFVSFVVTGFSAVFIFFFHFFLLGNHPCFSCKSADPEVTRCSVSGCGCFYHEDCVRKLPGTTNGSGGGFCCPQHSCSTCCLVRDVQRATKGGAASASFVCCFILLFESGCWKLPDYKIEKRLIGIRKR